MKRYIFILFSFLSFSSCCQGQVKKNKDKRMFQCNHEILKRYLVNTSILENHPLNFAYLPIADTSQMTELIFRCSPSDTTKAHATVPLFLIDTLHQNEWKNYSFYPNPRYFNYLHRIDPTHLKQKRQIIGQIEPNLLLKKMPPSILAEILVQFPIVTSYNYLHSDFIQLNKKETEDCYYVKYKVKWHICTNRCYSPTFRMAIEIDKKTGNITIIKK